MGLREQIIHSQLIPPKQRSGVLYRPRIDDLLAAALEYPVTIVQAGTGYGKTTALTSLSKRVSQLFWYTITEADRDPLLFLAKLFIAFEQRGDVWGTTALNELEANQGRSPIETVAPLVNALTEGLREDTVIVLDDYHHVYDIDEINAFLERLVEFCPPFLHIIISTRKLPQFDAINRWRIKGKLVTIRRKDLAFTREEIQSLFQELYHYNLQSDQLDALTTETGGWVIGLQMIWQALQTGAEKNVGEIIREAPVKLEGLFDYLASEVLSRQTEQIQEFLIASAVLRQMDPLACDVLLKASMSESLLEQLQENGLFITSVGENVYQYQNLFHDFLRTQLWQKPDRARFLHREVADYFKDSGFPEQTIYHLLEAEEFQQASELISEIGNDLINIGRFNSLLEWMKRIPNPLFNQFPGLQLLMGHIYRLRSAFDSALTCYLASEKLYAEQENALGRSHALRGQAQVYLDTIRPLKAESLLEEALKLLEPQEFHEETSALLDQLAENKLNLGHPDQAKALHHEARLLRNDDDPGDVYLEARALLRTGNLYEARLLLEVRAEEERANRVLRPQRFHRETLLLLSLICNFQGDREAANRYAQEGIDIGKHLCSTFVEAVGMIRKAHALQLNRLSPWFSDRLDQARELYEEAIEKVRVFKVTRVQVEPLWGLSRLYGYSGELIEAASYAERAMNIAHQAGDKWLFNLVKVNLGASYSMVDQPEEAQRLLAEAYDGFREVADTFSLAAVLLWQALTYWQEDEIHLAIEKMALLLPLAKAGRYEILLTQPTLLGLRDENAILPLLIEARQQGIEVVYIEQLLRKLGLAGVDYHPGYALVVRTLGLFDAYRGTIRVRSADWQREKARQLFQLFLTYRGEWLQREQIVDRLWPDLSMDAGIRDFKVALNALNRALEPTRPRRASPFFIVRRENLYAINPLAKIILDSEAFEELSASRHVEQLLDALKLYKGEYLADSLYNEWTVSKRDHLRQLYLMSLERLARIYLDQQKWDESINLCETIIRVERTWESAYTIMMQAYAAKKNRAQVHTVFQRCVEALDEELGIEPDDATRAMFERLA
jgi:DNA-binding SARP family transcriptional activator